MDQKIYPSPEELMKVNSLVHCTEEGCSSVFSSESNLTLHLVKSHRKEKLPKQELSREFYCPDLTCIYNGAKFFKTLKLLKQHYLKVHSEKSFICETCNKGFPTQSSKNNHVEYCGCMFKCIDCETSYQSYESLLTHSRRKKHNILEKSLYRKQPNTLILVDKSASNLDVNKKSDVSKKRNQYILPKGSVSLQLINVNQEKLMKDQSLQTDIFDAPKCQEDKGDGTLQIQIVPLQKSLSSAETQTVGDYITRKSSASELSSSSNENLRKSIKTQTKPVTSTTKSCNTSFNLGDFEFEPEIKVERNSSSTQTISTLPAELIYSTQIEPQKDEYFEDLFNCHMETQTDFFENELLSPDYYSHMYTQTCDEILLNDLGFNNTHTQTVFDDVLRSVESQTTMSQGSKCLMSCRDMAHMETQTDVEFKQILEEINA